jgi:hypothetical protein
MPNKLKILNLISKVLKLFAPGVIILTLFFMFSYIGVFIEEDNFLLLIGGFKNPLIVVSFYLLANFSGWIISSYIFRLKFVFASTKSEILFPIISFLIIIALQLAYYFIIFKYLTGIEIYQFDVLFSEKLINNIRNTLIMMLFSSILISALFNIYLIFASRSLRKPKLQSTPGMENNEIDTATATSFENSISI